MTSNQIAYWSHLEDKRSHQVNEVETQRHNKATEHNQYLQAQAALSQASTAAKRQAVDAELGYMQQELATHSFIETQRHNQATESLTQGQTQYNYYRTDVDRDLRDVANRIAQQNADINQQNANINQQRADTEKKKATSGIANDIFTGIASATSIGKLGLGIYTAIKGTNE